MTGTVVGVAGCVGGSVVSWSGPEGGWASGKWLREGPGWGAWLSALLEDPGQRTNGVHMKGLGLGGIECVEGQ